MKKPVKEKISIGSTWDEEDYHRQDQIATYQPPSNIFKEIAKDSKMAKDSCYQLFSSIDDPMSFKGYPYLAEKMQKSENRIACEESVNECLRKGYEIKCDSNNDRKEQIKILEEELKRFKVRSILQKAGMLGESMGVGHIIVKMKGDDQKNELSKPMPLDPAKIKKGALEGFIAVDPIWVTPKTYNASDPTDPFFFKPEIWYMISREIHADRMHQIIPYSLPDILKPAYNFGGLSLVQMMIPYVNNWEYVRDDVAKIIASFRTYILTTDMTAMQQSKAQFDRRLKQFQRGKDNHGILVINSEADESLEQVNTTLSELSSLLNNYLEQLCIPSRLSATKLTGIQPNGMNATGEGESNSLHETIASKQEKIYKPALDWMLKIIMLNKFGEIFDDIYIDFIPLKELSELEIAQLNKTNAETGDILINNGSLSSEQENARLAADPNSGYNGITYEEQESEDDYNPESDTPEQSDRSYVPQGNEQDDK